MFLAENFHFHKSSSIAFVRTNAPRGSSKIRRILGVREYGLIPPYYKQKEITNRVRRNVISFFVG